MNPYLAEFGAPSLACRGGPGWGQVLASNFLASVHPLPTSPCKQGDETTQGVI